MLNIKLLCLVEAGVKVDKKIEQAVAAPVEEKVFV